MFFIHALCVCFFFNFSKETSSGLQKILQEIQPRDTNDFFASPRELDATSEEQLHTPQVASTGKSRPYPDSVGFLTWFTSSSLNPSVHVNTKSRTINAVFFFFLLHLTRTWLVAAVLVLSFRGQCVIAYEAGSDWQNGTK